MAEVLGEVFEQFLRNKRADWDQYQAQVTPYELTTLDPRAVGSSHLLVR